MVKHACFAKHSRNNWGLPRSGKYIWLNFDKKWFYVMVLRTNAKMCEELGLKKMYTRIYQRNYVEKVMAVTVTGMRLRAM